MTNKLYRKFQVGDKIRPIRENSSRVNYYRKLLIGLKLNPDGPFTVAELTASCHYRGIRIEELATDLNPNLSFDEDYFEKVGAETETIPVPPLKEITKA